VKAPHPAGPRDRPAGADSRRDSRRTGGPGNAYRTVSAAAADTRADKHQGQHIVPYPRRRRLHANQSRDTPQHVAVLPRRAFTIPPPPARTPSMPTTLVTSAPSQDAPECPDGMPLCRSLTKTRRTSAVREAPGGFLADSPEHRRSGDLSATARSPPSGLRPGTPVFRRPSYHDTCCTPAGCRSPSNRPRSSAYHVLACRR